MTDPAVTIACIATSISILATAVALIALDSAQVARRLHRRLSDEFWKQSLEQAKENGLHWGFQLRQLEWLREHLPTAPRPRTKPQPPN